MMLMMTMRIMKLMMRMMINARRLCGTIRKSAKLGLDPAGAAATRNDDDNGMIPVRSGKAPAGATAKRLGVVPAGATATQYGIRS